MENNYIELQEIKEYRDKIRSAQFEAGAKMFLDRIFSNLEEIKIKDFPHLTFYIFNNEIIVEHDIKHKDFYYHYDKIHQVLEIEFRLKEQKINELMVSKISEHLKINNIKLYAMDYPFWR